MHDLDLPIRSENLSPIALAFLAGPHKDECAFGRDANGEGFEVPDETIGYPWGINEMVSYLGAARCCCPAPTFLAQTAGGSDRIFCKMLRAHRQALTQAVMAKAEKAEVSA